MRRSPLQCLPHAQCALCRTVQTCFHLAEGTEWVSDKVNLKIRSNSDSKWAQRGWSWSVELVKLGMLQNYLAIMHRRVTSECKKRLSVAGECAVWFHCYAFRFNYGTPQCCASVKELEGREWWSVWLKSLARLGFADDWLWMKLELKAQKSQMSYLSPRSLWWRWCSSSCPRCRTKIPRWRPPTHRPAPWSSRI